MSDDFSHLKDIWRQINTVKQRVSGLEHDDSALTSLSLRDSVTAPVAVSGQALVYVDSVDGDIKVRYGDGSGHVLGGAGAGDLNYIHNQAVPDATWTITHGLGKFPSVSVVDSAGSLVFGETVHINSAQLTVSFSAGFAGKAYLN